MKKYTVKDLLHALQVVYLLVDRVKADDWVSPYWSAAAAIQAKEFWDYWHDPSTSGTHIKLCFSDPKIRNTFWEYKWQCYSSKKTDSKGPLADGLVKGYEDLAPQLEAYAKAMMDVWERYKEDLDNREEAARRAAIASVKGITF